MTKNKKSLLITFEGGEGSGKTTLISSLEAYFKGQNFSVVKTREPGGTPLGEQIRNILLHQKEVKISDHAEILLFLASRVQQIEEVIKPALQNGSIVLCDRFNDSTVAYQGIARGMGQNLAEGLCESACQNLQPEITFFLDLDPKIGLQRTRLNSGKMDRLESLDLSFHQKVRQAYQKLAQENSERFFTLDASKNQNEVFQASLKCLKKFF